jgi:hypothetical protein
VCVSGLLSSEERQEGRLRGGVEGQVVDWRRRASARGAGRREALHGWGGAVEPPAGVCTFGCSGRQPLGAAGSTEAAACRDYDSLVRSTVPAMANPIQHPEPCEDIAEANECLVLLDYNLPLEACGCSCATAIAACGPNGCGGADTGPPEPEPEPAAGRRRAV